MFLEGEKNSGKLQIISRKFQNNVINIKQISLSHMIIYVILLECLMVIATGHPQVKKNLDQKQRKNELAGHPQLKKNLDQKQCKN